MKNLKINWSQIGVYFMLFFLFACNSSNKKQKHDHKQIKVVIVIPVTIDAFDELIRGVKEKFDTTYKVSVYSAEADAGKFDATIQSALLGSPDYLVTIGTQITNSAFGPKFVNNLPVVIAGAISEPSKVDALVSVKVDPPRSSQVAIVSDNPSESIYDLFQQTITSFLPGIKKVGIIYNPAEINSKTGTDYLSEALTKHSILVQKGVINSLDDVEKVTDNLLVNKVQAIIIPHDKAAVTKASSIVKRCDEKGIPVISLDQGTVHKDGVAIGISVNYKDVGNIIGETITKIESGQAKAADMPIVSLPRASVYVNTGKLSSLNITVPEQQKNTVIKY